jgi:membrane protease YdiL (CAAX protease family)
MIGAIVIFIIRLRRGDLALRFTLATGIACVILVGGVALNSIPAQLSYYDTTTSYPAFVGQIALQGIMQSLGTAMLLIVVVGAGEVLYRQRLPTQLAMPRIWSSRALTSRKVFRSLVLGYALVPLFMAYQVSFYLIARRYGAWAPAEVPYDDIVNTALPWVAVLFAGFFPAFSEEFLSRAFSIPFFQRIVRSRVFAIVIAGMIWGFGHATYPNQPFWIRGVEVGLAGIAAGFLMDRYGLLPLLIWHYTIDAVYTATLLFASGNTYYIVSAAVASLLFAFPMLIVIARYVRNRGFIPDDDLTNASIPIASAPPPVPHPPAAGFPAAMPPARRNLIIAAAVVTLAAAAWMIRPASPDDAIDYRITKDDAKRVARAHVTALHGNRPIGGAPLGEMRVIAAPDAGFRSWIRDSAREDGGAPGGFDDIAATHLVHSGLSVDALVALFRDRLEAGTWSVRFFRPMVKEEIFVEVDGRSPRVVGYHKYQDEANPGPSLAREQAVALAQRAFVVYGVDPRGFTLEEALSFQKPRRRDWLFHFQERSPIAGRAFRRVTIRIAGAEVTQFNKTIHVPESVYREAQTQTLLNVVLLILKLGGIVALLAAVLAGLVIASREGGFFWRRPLRWTALLALVPVVAFLARYESTLFSYSTSVAWETYRVSLLTSFVGEVALQAGVLFLALCGLQAAFPYALDLARREGRLRFGRSAVIAAVTAVAAVTLFETLSVFVAHAFPSAASVSLGVSGQIASPFPALIQAARALFAAIVVGGAVALYSLSVRTKRGFVTIAAIFCIAIDPAVSIGTAPLMLVHALALAVVVWLIARYVLNGNPLAWPLAVFTGLTLQSAVTLLQNDRPDLLANGLALVAAAISALVWAGAESKLRIEN